MSEEDKEPVAASDAETSPEGAEKDAAKDVEKGADASPAEDVSSKSADASPAAEDTRANPVASPAPKATAPASTKAAWGDPLAKLDRAWTKLDARLCATVLLAEVITLVFWISMKALASTGRGGPGMVFRCMVTALVFGVVTHLVARKRVGRHELVSTAAVAIGLVAGSFWGDAGSHYFANLLAWMQNASIFVFFGGASAIAKRLTLWLALLGASVATGQGKHINVDVVMRFLSPRARVPVAVLGWLTAAVVCGAAVWGFFDHVAVEDYRVPTSMPCATDASEQCPTPPSAKIARVAHDTGRDLFLAGRQISLDLRTLPKVLGGTPYGESLTPKEWNAWLRDGGWEKHFAAEDVQAMVLPEDGSGPEFRTPAVTSIPGEPERIHELLVRELNFVVAFGLLVIAIRFVLRSLLAISGHVKVDPNAAHSDDDLAETHDPADVAGHLPAAQEEAAR